MIDAEESKFSDMEKGNIITLSISTDHKIHLAQKMLAEFIGTFCIIFTGCGLVVVNKLYDGIVTFPGICVTWGLIVMAMVYTVGHVSGAHFNPVVTITLSLLGLCPYKEVAFYILSQLLGSIVASGTLCLIMNVTSEAHFGTTPSGSTLQSFVVEIIITFILMFIVSGATIDHRAVYNEIQLSDFPSTNLPWFHPQICGIKPSTAVGSMYRSPELYAKLRRDMDVDNSTADAVSVLQSLP
ncbi:hypothetical protein L1987_34214 [Smallanthus sonchifolius]|uniref:Uncharacterized protein n=1 Tax=Smallanthus sonchifolius TaxID=185202 RepID=A0ACB9HT25_9ASTR|nr:hypothetical protein L1987_34214 [Smallanthus sonchifolius]